MVIEHVIKLISVIACEEQQERKVDTKCSIRDLRILISKLGHRREDQALFCLHWYNISDSAEKKCLGSVCQMKDAGGR